MRTAEWLENYCGGGGGREKVIEIDVKGEMERDLGGNSQAEIGFAKGNRSI